MKFMNNTAASDLLIILGNKVKKRRSELNLSQEKLASLCGFDRTYISLIERGRRNISFVNLTKLVDGLETTISELTKDIYGFKTK
jgi:transcriptional regulator with XRE-family HTH domain